MDTSRGVPSMITYGLLAAYVCTSSCIPTSPQAETRFLPADHGDVSRCGGKIAIVSLVVRHERVEAVGRPLAR